MAADSKSRESFGRYWHLMVAASLAAVAIVVSYFFPRVGGTIWSICNAESSIAFWVEKVGLPFRAAEKLAIWISSAETVVWIVSFLKFGHFFVEKLKPLYEKVMRYVDLGAFNGESEWLRTLCGIIRETIQFIVPPMPSATESERTPWTTFQLYLRIAVYGFIPAYMFTAAGFSAGLALQGFVNIWIAAAIILAFNFLKMEVCGFIGIHLPWLLSLILFWIMPAAAVYLKKRLTGEIGETPSEA